MTSAADVKTDKITQDELVQMFGDRLPIEVVNIIWNAAPDETLGEIRRKVRELAATRKTTITPSQVIASAVECVCSDGNSDPRRVSAHIIRALEAAGFRIVPKVATGAMIDAGWIDKEDVSPAEIYTAMLAAHSGEEG